MCIIDGEEEEEVAELRFEGEEEEEVEEEGCSNCDPALVAGRETEDDSDDTPAGVMVNFEPATDAADKGKDCEVSPRSRSRFPPIPIRLGGVVGRLAVTDNMSFRR